VRYRLILYLPVLLAAITVSPVLAQDQDSTTVQEVGEARSGSSTGRPATFGGPDQVDNQIANDQASTSRLIKERLIDPYFAWKEGLQEEHDLAFSIDYSAAYLRANESPGEDTAASGMVRFFGSWDLVGRESGNTGAFVWKVEHRHAYTDVAPQGFGFNLGYVGLIEPPFSNQGWRFTNFYWRQRWKQGKVAMLAGFLDVTDFVDVHALASPWTGFLNFAFSTGTLTLPVPNDAALGVGAGGMVTKNLFLIGSLVDRNADPKRFWEGFDTFFDQKEYFKSIEIGWTTSQEQIYLNNTHLTIWQADDREAAGEAGGWGANFSWTRYLAETWLPFVRAGYADGGGSVMQKSVSVGAGYQPDPGGNVLGLGFNWGEVNEDTWGPGLSDQLTAELYFRWNLSPQFALTPDIQYLVDPALNPEEDSLWVLGLRARLAL
jgi:porin